MAHMLESKNDMIYVGEVPWHGLGIELKTPPATIEDALIVAGMDWRVEKRVIFTPSRMLLDAKTPAEKAAVPSDKRGIQIPDQFAMIRSSDERPLGVVGADYVPVQNEDAFGHLNGFLLDGIASVETAGMLKGGSTVWMMLKLKMPFEVLPGDEVCSYLLATTSHDGSRVYQHRYTPIRVVCNNTLSAAAPKREAKADAAKGAAFKRRHTTNALSSITEASRILRAVHDSAAASQELFRAMAQVQMTRKSMQEFLAELIPDNANATRNTRTENMREEVMGFVDGGVGTDIKGVRGSLWGLYNGVTEWLDHAKGTEGGNIAKDKADTRLFNLWFGAGQAMKDKALDLSMALV